MVTLIIMCFIGLTAYSIIDSIQLKRIEKKLDEIIEKLDANI